jgi:hypothetical protein
VLVEAPTGELAGAAAEFLLEGLEDSPKQLAENADDENVTPSDFRVVVRHYEGTEAE